MYVHRSVAASNNYHLCEELARLAETRLAQTTLDYLKLAYVTFIS